MLRSQSICFCIRSRAVGDTAEKGCSKCDIWKTEGY